MSSIYTGLCQALFYCSKVYPLRWHFRSLHFADDAMRYQPTLITLSDHTTCKERIRVRLGHLGQELILSNTCLKHERQYSLFDKSLLLTKADAKLLMLPCITAKLQAIFSCALIWMVLLPFHTNNLFKLPKTCISFFQRKNMLLRLSTVWFGFALWGNIKVNLLYTLG